MENKLFIIRIRNRKVQAFKRFMDLIKTHLYIFDELYEKRCINFGTMSTWTARWTVGLRWSLWCHGCKVIVVLHLIHCSWLFSLQRGASTKIFIFFD